MEQTVIMKTCTFPSIVKIEYTPVFQFSFLSPCYDCSTEAESFGAQATGL